MKKRDNKDQTKFYDEAEGNAMAEGGKNENAEFVENPAEMTPSKTGAFDIETK